jgi:hypothetical protein
LAKKKAIIDDDGMKGQFVIYEADGNTKVAHVFETGPEYEEVNDLCLQDLPIDRVGGVDANAYYEAPEGTRMRVDLWVTPEQLWDIKRRVDAAVDALEQRAKARFPTEGIWS